MMPLHVSEALTIAATGLALFGGLFSAAVWVAGKPSEDKVRKIVSEHIAPLHSDLSEIKRDIKELMKR